MATLDSQQIFDGGWLLGLGQEDALTDWISTYRQLPAERFDTLVEDSQPVVVRTLAKGGKTYVYLVNDSSWPVKITLAVDLPPAAKLEKLGDAPGVGPLLRTGETAGWTVSLQPYELAAARFSAPDVRFHGPQLKLPADVVAGLERRIRDLSATDRRPGHPLALGRIGQPRLRRRPPRPIRSPAGLPKEPNRVCNC